MRSGVSICFTNDLRPRVPVQSAVSKSFFNHSNFFQARASNLPNHFKDTRREAVEAMPKLLLFFFGGGRFWGVFAQVDSRLYCLKITRNPRRQFSLKPTRTTSISRDK